MKPKLILCADLHFRDDQPVCRTDDFFQTQIEAMKWLKALQVKHDVPVLCSGDYFHNWKPSPRLLSACLEHMPFVYTIPGNHDLPQHSLDLVGKCGLMTLARAKKVHLMLGELDTLIGFTNNTLFGKSKTHPGLTFEIGVIHTLINHPQTTTDAKSILKKYKDYDLILSGDNHQTFTEKLGKRLLVNPGSFTRQTASQIDHKPAVFLWFEDNHVEAVEVPIEDNVITRNHLEKVEQRDERMNVFVKRLNDDYEVELSFENNIEAYFLNNRTRKSVKSLVFESMEV